MSGPSPLPPASESFLATLLAHLRAAVITLDADLRIKTWSPGAERMIGWRADEVIGRHFHDIWPPDAPPERVREVDEQLLAGRTVEIVSARPCKDGRAISTEASITALRDPDGTLTGYLFVAHDVSRLDAAQQALREQAAQAELRARELATVVDASSDGYLAIDLTTGKIERSRQLAELVGVAPSAPDLDADAMFARIHPDDVARPRAAYQAMRDGRAVRVDEEYRIRTPGGWRWLRMRGSVVARDAQGHGLRAVCVSTDVDAERHTQERQLHEARLRGLSERINEIELVMRLDGSIVEANDRALSAYGYDRAEMLTRNIRDLRAPGTRPAVEPQMARAAKPGGFRFETNHQRRDGTTFPVEVSSRSFEVGGEIYLHSLVLDRTESQRSDAERRLLAHLVTAMDDAVIATDLERRITAWSGASERLYGWTEAEVLGRDIDELFDPIFPDGDEDVQLGKLRDGLTMRAYVQPRHKDGSRVDVDLIMVALRGPDGRLEGRLSVSRDIAQDKRQRAELQASHQQLAMVLAATQEGFWDLDVRTGQRMWSARAARMLGVTPAELGASNREWWARVHPEDLARVQEALDAHLSGRTSSFDVQLRARTGEGAWLRVRSRGKAVDWDREGVPTRIIGTLSEAGAATSELVEALALNRKLVDELYCSKESAWLTFEQAGVGLAHLGLDGRFRRINRYGCRILGVPEAEAHLLPLVDIVHPEDRDVDATLRRELLAGERSSYSMERRYLRKDRAVIWCRLTASVVCDAEGRPEHFIEVIEDITARREVEEKLRLVSEQSLLGVAILQEGRVVFANQATADLNGYSISEMLGWSMIDFGRLIHPDDLPFAREQARKKMRGEPGVVSRYDYRLITKGGEVRWVDQVSQTVQHQGRPADLVTLLDITDRKRAEARLAEKSRHYERLMANARDAVHILDLEGKLREYNPAFLAHLGYSPEELRGLSVADWDAQLDAAEIQATIARLVREPTRFETRHRRKDGTIREVELECGPIDEDGELLLYASARDITDRKRADEELRRLWHTVEQAPVTIIITDASGHIEYVNPGFERSTGYTAAEVRGKDPQSLLSPDLDPATHAALQDAVFSGRGWRGELHYRTRSGKVVAVRAHILPLHDASGRLTHFLGVELDVTREREAQEEAARLTAELEQRVAERTAELELALRSRDGFLAAMSHELRTPLNAVLGFSEALAESTYGPLTAPQQRVLRRIEESGRHLLALITDVLDVSKLEAGTLVLELQPVLIGEVCRASLRLVQESAKRKAQTLSLTVDEGLGAVLADGPRLKQILLNLLSNAVKFTPAGGAIELRAGPEGDSMVRFTVRDTGIGIAPEDRSRVFQPFVQLDASLARAQSGTGLGLALVQRLASLHGGRVELESELGVGSRFSVILPRLGARPFAPCLDLGRSQRG